MRRKGKAPESDLSHSAQDAMEQATWPTARQFFTKQDRLENASTCIIPTFMNFSDSIIEAIDHFKNSDDSGPNSEHDLMFNIQFPFRLLF